MLDNIKKEFSTRTLVLIPIAIAINIAVGQLVYVLKLPIYLDSIGTVLVGALVGPWAGAVTGGLANLLWGVVPPPLQNAYAVPFFYVAIVIGLMAGYFGKRGIFEKESPRWLSTLIGAVFFFALALFIMTFTNLNPDGSLPAAADLLSRYTVVFAVAILAGAAVGYFLLQKGGYAGLAGLATGVVAAIISAPTAAIVFGGVTGGGTDLLVAAFRASGTPLMSSVLAQGSVSDPFDKMLSYMIVWLILQSLPTRFKAR
jgi:energy-coupling factor transport system substrate-specific component